MEEMMQSNFTYTSALYHHGIKGQKWGERNGPPYPLDEEDHSAREKKLNNLANEKFSGKLEPTSGHKLTERQKKILKRALLVGAGVAITGAAVYAYSKTDFDVFGPTGIAYRPEAPLPIEAFKDLCPDAKTAHTINEKLFDQNMWDSLSKNEQMAVIDYTTNDGFTLINKTLRNLPIYDENLGYVHKQIYENGLTGELINNVTNAINKSVTKEPIRVSREISQDGLCGFFGGLDLRSMSIADKKALIGLQVSDPAFISTTVDNFKSAKDYGKVTLRILMPKGTKALYVGPKSEFSFEHEYILQRGTKFLIRDLDFNLDGDIKEAILEVVDQNLDAK